MLKRYQKGYGGVWFVALVASAAINKEIWLAKQKRAVVDYATGITQRKKNNQEKESLILAFFKTARR